MTALRLGAAPAMTDRFDFAFSGNGRHGVCLHGSDGAVRLESWRLHSEEAVHRPVTGVAVGRTSHAVPLDDGRILLSRGVETGSCQRHQLSLLQPAGGTFAERPLGEVTTLLGGGLLASPGPARLGFFVARDDPERSTIWRLSPSAPRIEPVVRVPGSLSGGVWLDADAGVLAMNQDLAGRTSGVAIDLGRGEWRRIWSVSDTSTDRIVLYSPRSKLLVVTTNATGEERLGWVLLGQGEVTFPESLHRPGHLRKALALDTGGERLLVHDAQGAVSRLYAYTPADRQLQPLAGPAGVVSPPAMWVGDLVRFRFSAPDQPPTLATVRVGTPARWSVSRDGDAASGPAWAGAELVELQGPAGPIETIVYGGPAWWRCRHLVVALHGGPLSSWRFEFEPLFQRLAAAGVAVLAPNYRGSVGYGDAYLRTVVTNWGGPDLDDVLHLGRHLERTRAPFDLPKPVVLGASYGAYLALLAACREPELWSGCVALAPFLSGPRLYDSAPDVVRSRVEQLGGRDAVEDASGSRDVLRACGSLSAPLLLVHGTRDLAVPVEQSRTLARRLFELGRAEGDDVEYLEVDDDHAGVASARSTALGQRIVRFCLSRRIREPCSAHREEPCSARREAGEHHAVRPV